VHAGVLAPQARAVLRRRAGAAVRAGEGRAAARHPRAEGQLRRGDGHGPVHAVQLPQLGEGRRRRRPPRPARPQAGRVRLDRQLLRRPRLAARRTGGGARDARRSRGGLRARRPRPGLSAADAGREGLRPAARPAGRRGRHAAVARRRRRQGILAGLPQLLRHQPLQPLPDVFARRAPAGAGDRRQRRAMTGLRTAGTRALPLLAAAAALALAGCASDPKKSASEASALPDGDRVGRSELPSSRKRSPYAPAQEDPSKRGHYTAGGLYAPHIKDSVPDDLPDVDAIPEPEVVDEPRSRYGNRSPYKVLGKSYKVRDSAEGYGETGMASYYGNKFHGRRTSNLEVY